jgi:hypothetical protein
MWIRKSARKLRAGIAVQDLTVSSATMSAFNWQSGGRSRSGIIQQDGSAENWRCIEVDGLSDLTIEDGVSHTAPCSSSQRTCINFWDTIEAPYLIQKDDLPCNLVTDA